MDQNQNTQSYQNNQEVVNQKLSSEQNYSSDYELVSRKPSNKNLYLIIFSLLFIIVLTFVGLIFAGIIKF